MRKIRETILYDTIHSKKFTYINAMYEPTEIHVRGCRVLLSSCTDLKLMNFAKMSQCSRLVLR
jgi:hypothetical protein